jgi:AraC-like DNA-binding protein
MAFSIETVKMIELPSKPSHYLFIKEHPCISLSDDENESLFELFDLAKKKSIRGNYLFQKEIEEKISMLISYEIAAIYAKGEPIEEKERPRQDIIFRNFLFSLAKNYKDKKDVNFYAQEQYITPRYLSYIVKEISGRGSAQWIISYVIREAKMLLTSSQMTIQQVSDELGFANPSFFSQYIKKYTGSTPKQFRKKENTIAN